MARRGVGRPEIVALLFITLLLLTTMTTTSALAEKPDTDNTVPAFQDDTSGDYWPTEGWRNSTPQEHGMNNKTLYDMLELIEAEDYPIYSIVIVKDGYIVFEQYLNDLLSAQWRHLLHSVTKSFAGTLIGIAIQQGLLSGVNATVLDFFPEYEIANPDPRKNRITIEDLLTMTPGLEWDEWSTPYEDPATNTLMGMMASSDAVQFVLDRPMAHEPGTTWTYCGGASILLGAIIEQVSEYSTHEFAREYLFDPLGFGYSNWFLAPGGWYNTQGGLKLTTRDIARLGYLYLNNGTWDGVQILPADFIAHATSPIDIPNAMGTPFGYGWHWWTRSDLGIYFAFGRYGQKIMVSPEHDLVVAFNAMVRDGEYDPEFDLFRDYILRSVEEGPDSGTTGVVTTTGTTPSALPLQEVVIVFVLVGGMIGAAVVIGAKRR